MTYNYIYETNVYWYWFTNKNISYAYYFENQIELNTHVLTNVDISFFFKVIP